MERLIAILRAAHCRSTHHFFAVDALEYVTTDRGRSLCNVLLRHHDRYLAGAKDPDTRFRDFRNHVLHVSDGHWGGAPKTAEKWYGTLIEALDQTRWSDAAYAAGVLSHYFTDPLMPLHTAQSKIESVVHRPLEWSVTKSYPRIFDRWKQGDHHIVFELAGSSGWLGEAVTAGAEVAHRHYQQLIDDYDLAAGAKRPTEGFNDRSIDTLAGLFGVAITGWAKILERAASQTQSDIPRDPLLIQTLVAAIQMPVAWIVRRIDSASQQRAVKAIFDEYRETGKVKKNLPLEVKSVRDQRSRDRTLQRDQERFRKARVASEISHPTDPPEVLTAAPDQVSSGHESSASRRATLAATDNLVDAPSIGPKTAKRFAAVGITTVRQFLAASPSALADQLDTRWITAEKVADWQDQAQLVCDVPSLCGYKAQLLVGVDCRDVQTLAGAKASPLQAQIEQFCATSAGRRALRNSSIPSRDDVAQWIRDAGTSPLRRSA